MLHRNSLHEVGKIVLACENWKNRQSEPSEVEWLMGEEFVVEGWTGYCINIVFWLLTEGYVHCAGKPSPVGKKAWTHCLGWGVTPPRHWHGLISEHHITPCPAVVMTTLEISGWKLVAVWSCWTKQIPHLSSVSSLARVSGRNCVQSMPQRMSVRFACPCYFTWCAPQDSSSLLLPAWAHTLPMLGIPQRLVALEGWLF